MQIDNMYLDQITQSVLDVFNRVNETSEELTRKINDVLREAIERFDLVTREEFDAANELLSNTRIKLEQMEKRVAELEAAISEKESLHATTPPPAGGRESLQV